MDDNKLTNHNKVKAKGRIISIGRDDFGHSNLVLFIRGGRDARPVYISFALNTDVPLNVTTQSYVNIEGHVTAYSFRNEVWGRQSYVQYFVADKIELDKTQIEEAYPEECAGQGFAHNSPFVEVALKGEITNIYKSEQHQEGSDAPRIWTRLTLRVPHVGNDLRDSSINVQYSSSMRVSDVPIHVGDKICLTAIVSSKRKNADGTTVDDRARVSYRRRDMKTYEDIIVNDIVVVEPAQPETDPEEVAKVLVEEETVAKQLEAKQTETKKPEAKPQEYIDDADEKEDETNFFSSLKK